MGAVFLGSGARLVRGARDALVTEAHTDCVLVSMEGVAVRVHRALLAPSNTLRNILSGMVPCLKHIFQKTYKYKLLKNCFIYYYVADNQG